VQSYLSKESTGRWLLVFDNTDDINMWIGQSGPGSGRLIDYLPRSEQGYIVFTTRNRKTAVKLARQNVVEVPEMDEDVAMLARQNVVEVPEMDEDVAIQIVQYENAFMTFSVSVFGQELLLFSPELWVRIPEHRLSTG
jgi:uncharacterized protein YuzE